jgi:hypothetical protein
VIHKFIEEKEVYQVVIVPVWHTFQWPPLRAYRRSPTTTRR